jgi:uncharacterized tellurite resistance protein B-like protein
MPSDIDRLKIAFALYVTRKIVNADDTVHPDEVALVHKGFPPRQLEKLGFIEPGPGSKLTAAYHAACKEAVERLPRALTVPEKEEFMNWFHHVCAADGTIDEREVAIMSKAREILGI